MGADLEPRDHHARITRILKKFVKDYDLPESWDKQYERIADSNVRILAETIGIKTAETEGRTVLPAPRLYVAGPITGVENFRENFAAAKGQLEAIGYDVISPPEVETTLPPMTRPELIALGLLWVNVVDGVALLPGWEHSSGATAEKAAADASGKPTAPVAEWLSGKACIKIGDVTRAWQ